MPTYQYACTECDHGFEQVQSFSEDSLTECPVCHGRLRKVYNAVGVVFKGSGFYRTDSREGTSSSESSGSSGDSKESSGSSGSSEKGSDKGSGSADKGSGSSAAKGSDKGSGSADKGSSGSSGSAKSATSTSG